MAESFNAYQSVYRLRWVGYCFLLFALINNIVDFIPANVGDLAWRLQFLGKLVETVIIPILGFALIFGGEHYGRKPFEKPVLKILSWFCLALTVIFLLLIPPTFLAGLQLQTQLSQGNPNLVEQRLTQQAAPVLEQLNQLERQLKQGSPEQIKALGEQIVSQGTPLNTDDPEKVKSDLLSRVNQLRAQAQAQIKVQTQAKIQELEAQKLEIRKNSIKWSLGALIASVLFFMLWNSTRWARS
ncbi:MAG: HpsJ family protein [Kovacikia sp.]